MSRLLGRGLLVAGIAAALAAPAGWAVWRNAGLWTGAPQTVPSPVASAILGPPPTPGPSADEEGTLPAARVVRPPASQPASPPAPQHRSPRASPPAAGLRGVRDLRSVPSPPPEQTKIPQDRKSTRLNSSHANISYAVFCLKKKRQNRSAE